MKLNQVLKHKYTILCMLHTNTIHTYNRQNKRVKNIIKL